MLYHHISPRHNRTLAATEKPIFNQNIAAGNNCRVTNVSAYFKVFLNLHSEITLDLAGNNKGPDEIDIAR